MLLIVFLKAAFLCLLHLEIQLVKISLWGKILQALGISCILSKDVKTLNYRAYKY